MTNTQGTISGTTWTKVGVKTQTPILLGRAFSPTWLSQSEEVIQVRLGGTFASNMKSLIEAAKLKKRGMNLPIASLRVGLMAAVDGLSMLDKDFGFDGKRPAIEILANASSTNVADLIQFEIERWLRNSLANWSHKYDLDAPFMAALKAFEADRQGSIQSSTHAKPLVGPNGIDYGLIARKVGELLISEELFGEEFGECELVASDYHANSVELMTLPKRVDRQVFSMVARITVGTMPLVQGVFLNTRVMKRVWADKLPTQKFSSSSPRSVKAYVMRPGHPAIPISTRFDNGWNFAEEYQRAADDSSNQLPVSLTEAVKQRDFDFEKGWWVGLQELPALYKSVSSRTAFELDEFDLFSSVVSSLGSVLSSTDVPFKEVPISGKESIGDSRQKTQMHVLRLHDIGVAGSSLLETVDPDDEDSDSIAPDSTDDTTETDKARSSDLSAYRDQNIRALTVVHGQNRPLLWIIGGTPDHQSVIEKASKALFGDKVEVAKQLMPLGVHGLESALDGTGRPSPERFDLRVNAWKPLTDQIASLSAKSGRTNFILICAPDEINGKPEDPVNYFAGIHAFSKIGANVHHVLPPEAPGRESLEETKLRFLQRVQSALLDVFLAHSGIVLKLTEFIASFQSIKAKAVYGIQCVRSLKKVYGESSVAFMLFTRLPVDTGVVETKIIYRSGTKNKSTSWMKLSESLSWLGTQRNLNESDSRWLKENFVNEAKTVIAEIANEDPNAIVLIDQEPLSGLWPGIRDEDLNATGIPTIGPVNLATLDAVKGLTFVRIRRNSATIGLRSKVTNKFENANGIVEEDYYTTGKTILDLTPSTSTGKTFGHFITSMGYSNKAKGKRGFSCFKKTSRFTKISKGKDSKEFEKKEMSPPRMELQLPAPSDVTVLRCPMGVEPSTIALLVTGLRVGTAHFNDWTSLPAPLFFQRKVDDYIIRFNGSEDVAVSDVSLPEIDLPPVEPNESHSNTSPSQSIETLSERDLGLVPGIVHEVLGTNLVKAEPLPEVIAQRPNIPTQDAELILVACEKQKAVPILPMTDSKSYARMMSGQVHIRVDLPYFVETIGIFGPPTKMVSRYISKAWERLRDNRYVRLSGVPQPTQENLLDWLANNYLHKPQACLGLHRVTIPIVPIHLEPLRKLVEKFNADKEDKIDYRGYTTDALTRLIDYANANNDDELLAWIIFQIVQYPIESWTDVFRSSITNVIGPMTRSALRYAINCADAIVDILTQERVPSNSFQPVIYNAPSEEAQEKKKLEHAAKANALKAISVSQEILVSPTQPNKLPTSDTTVSQPIAQSTPDRSNQQDLFSDKPVLEVAHPAADPIVDAPTDKTSPPKNDGHCAVGLPKPGADDFDESIAKLRTQIEALEAQHAVILEKKKQEAIALAEGHALMQMIASILISLTENSILHQYTVTPFVTPESVTIFVDSGDLEETILLISEVNTLNQRSETLESKELPKSAVERLKLSNLRNACLEQIVAAEENLKTSIERFAKFSETDGEPPSGHDDPPDELDDAPTESKEAPTQQPQPIEQVSSMEPATAASSSIGATTEQQADPLPAPDNDIRAHEDVTLPQIVSAEQPSGIDTQQPNLALEPPIELVESQACASQELQTSVVQPQLQQLNQNEVVTPHVEEQKQAIEIPKEVVAEESPAIAPQPPPSTPKKPQPLDAQDSEDSQLVNASDSTELLLPDEEFAKKVITLNVLTRGRLYGLATVHVKAMSSWVATLDPESKKTEHCAVMRNVVAAMYDVDGRNNFDFQLSDDLKTLLDSGELPRTEIKDPAIMAVGVLSCGLPTMLFEKSDWQWSIGNAVTNCLNGYSAVSDLINHIDLIRRHGYQLNREKFLTSHIGTNKAVRQELKRLSKIAENWKESGEVHSNWTHRGFRQMHDEIYSGDSFVSRCLRAIADGNLTKAKEIYTDNKRRFDKPADTVNDFFKKINELSKPDGRMRQQAIENIEITKTFIEKCIALTDSRDAAEDSLDKMERQFLVDLDRKLTDALTEVNTLSARTSTEAFYLQAAKVILKRSIELFEEPKVDRYIRNDIQQLMVQLPLNRDIFPSTKLCTPIEIFEETTRLATWATDVVVDKSLDSDSPAIKAALAEELDIHLQNDRFLPAYLIEKHVGIRKVNNVAESVSMKHSRALATLSTKIQTARAKVTHAMALSAIPSDEASNMLRLIETVNEVKNSDHSIGDPQCTSFEYPDLPHAVNALEINVSEPLEKKIQEAATKLRDELQLLDEKLEDNMVNVSKVDIERVRSMIEAKNPATLRTAFDAFQALQRGERLPAPAGFVVDVAKKYEEFLAEICKNCSSQKVLLESICDILLSNQESRSSHINSMSREHREEAASFIYQWKALFTDKNHRTAGDQIASIFKAIGVNDPPTVDMSVTTRAGRFKLDFPNRIFTLAPDPEDDVFVPPELGSHATQIEGCVILGDVNPGEFRQLKKGTSPVVVLQHTRMSLKKRAELSWDAHFVIIDDDLIIYMALHKPEERLRCLLRVCVLTYGNNPYRDYLDRPVPAEMFFGRQLELERLRNVQSFAVLYGGRRLGKSSLLGQIEIETKQSGNGNAVYINMHDANTSADYVAEGYAYISVALHRRGLIDAAPDHILSDRKLIQKHIEEELIRRPNLKSLYLLIDEADELMGKEISRPTDDIGLVSSLLGMASRVLGASGCHVRFVFAGLHNITRMTNEGNSAFGKSDTIALETFQGETMRGVRLITKPLAAMGYLFTGPGAEDMPLRILSVCNYYPALIQVYCSRLLERLQNNRTTSKPSLQITSNDLDDVESDQKLLEQMQQKFKYNLDLDNRYKAISLILAENYYDSLQSGKSSGMTIDEIRELCQLIFDNHFKGAGTGAFEALLLEMQKLTFLIRTGNQYFLRNPHIAMMIGDRQRVRSLIDELALHPPEKIRNQGERRVVLESKTTPSRKVTLPLPSALMGNLLEKTGREDKEFNDQDLIVLTGNKLSGVMEIASFNKEEYVPKLDDWSFELLPTANMLSEHLKKERRFTGGKNRRSNILTLAINGWYLESFADLESSAAKAAKKLTRVFLLAGPDKAYQLSKLIDDGVIAEKPGKGWRVLPIPHWTEDALFYKLFEKDPSLANNPRLLSAILSGTCGFEKEIHNVCSGLISLDQTMRAIEVAKKVLASDLDTFYDRLGIPVTTIPKDLLARAETALPFINGSIRGSSDELDALNEYEIGPGFFSFLQWMGLVQIGDKGTWKVPDLYIELLEQK
jgi:hypothetical protein